MKEALDYFFRMIDNRLTPEEQEEQKQRDIERNKKTRSNNPYCAFGGDLEGEEILSLDTH